MASAWYREGKSCSIRSLIFRRRKRYRPGTRRHRAGLSVTGQASAECGDSPLKRIHHGSIFRVSIFPVLIFGVSTFALFALPSALVAQLPAADAVPPSYSFTTAAPLGSFDGRGADGGGSGRAAGGSSGAGQVEPAAYADRYLTRGAIRSSVSPLGTGVELATNLPYRIDLRVFGNYTNFDWKLTQSGFYIVVNIGMANAGAMADYYPWKSLRFSPGYLLYNTNRVSANLQANTGATFTINNVTYISDNANPVHGVGALQLGGRGFMATTGWGHIVSRNTKHWNFPFEAGVAFINTPSVAFSLQGDVCQAQGYVCVPASSYPGFQSNLNAQLASWNKRVAPFHIYPLIEGGFSYTFRYRK
jgi:hypothetical protein